MTLDQRFKDKTAEVCTVHRRKRTPSLSRGCSNGIDDVRFCALSHNLSPFSWRS